MSEQLTSTLILYGAEPLGHGARVEVLDSNGVRRSTLRVIERASTTTITVRGWRWYDWLRWHSLKRVFRWGINRVKALVVEK